MSPLKEDDNILLMDAMLYAREGKDSAEAIYNQEKRGANKVKMYSMLPRKANINSVPDYIRFAGTEGVEDYEERSKIVDKNIRNYTVKVYNDMGIVIEETDDELFFKATLPDGWEIKNTDHSMWNQLWDDKNRLRATFFYKAAFYDRGAFINFNTRYNIGSGQIPPEGVTDIYEQLSSEERDKLPIKAWVKDFDGSIIFETEEIYKYKDGKLVDYYEEEHRLRNLCKSWLDETYPDWENVNAYWN